MSDIETELQIGSRYRFWTVTEDAYLGVLISVHNGWVQIDTGSKRSYLNMAHIESIEVST